MNKDKYDKKIIFALILIPFIGIVGTAIYISQYGIVWQEPFLLFIFWILTGLGITVGYHRLFSHRSFVAHPILEWLLSIFGAAALEMSAIRWCANHRKHHKYLDTDKDPYSITKGFFHAHMGWILMNNPVKVEQVDDLLKKPALKFQDKYYFLIFIVAGVLLPISLGFIWGRPFGALLWGVFLRISLVHHFTYFINSLCHYIGKKPYDHKSTSRDSWYMALLTFGEGFHNFHHRFQWDYRNGIRWFHFDPSKWLIWSFSKIGLAKNLKKADYFIIMKAKSLTKWNQANIALETIPEQFRKNYNNKLIDLRNKIAELEESLKQTKLFINKNNSLDNWNGNMNLLKVQYQNLLKSLSVILITIQNTKY